MQATVFLERSSWKHWSSAAFSPRREINNSTNTKAFKKSIYAVKSGVD